jgi:hypothetical protein
MRNPIVPSRSWVETAQSWSSSIVHCSGGHCRPVKASPDTSTSPTSGIPSRTLAGIGVADGRPYLTIYVEVEDLHQIWTKALGLVAGPVLRRPFYPDIQRFDHSSAAYPDGNVIGLSRRPQVCRRDRPN